MPTFTAPKRKTMFTSGRHPSDSFRNSGLGYLLKEDGFKLLKEDGFGIVLEADVYTRLFTAPKRVVHYTAPRKDPAWTPLALAPSMWYAASSLQTAADGDLVSELHDLSGHGFTRTRSGAARPVFKKSILNGWPVLRNDGTKSLDISGITVTIGTVVAVAGNVTYANAMSLDKQVTALQRIITFFPNGTTIYAGDANEFMGAAAIPTRIDGTATYTFSAGYHVVSQTHATGSAVTATNKNFSLMVGNSVFNGDLAEIIYFPTILGASDLLRVEQWLGLKYGITIA